MPYPRMMMGGYLIEAPPSEDIAFPQSIFNTHNGVAIDQLHPSNTIARDGTGGAPGIGDFIGRFAWLGAGMTNAPFSAESDEWRAILNTVDGKKAIIFDGTNDGYRSDTTIPPLRVGGASTVRRFIAGHVTVPTSWNTSVYNVMFHSLDTADNGNKYVSMMQIQDDHVRVSFSNNATTTHVSMSHTFTAGEHYIEILVVVHTDNNASGAQLTMWVDGTQVYDAAAPTATSGTNNAHGRLMFGANYFGTSYGNFMTLPTRRPFILQGEPTSGERNTLKQWSAGTTYVV